LGTQKEARTGGTGSPTAYSALANEKESEEYEKTKRKRKNFVSGGKIENGEEAGL